jgi:molybdenum cofactor cytidylyltransferase/nicotine blue oxidoreductase
MPKALVTLDGQPLVARGAQLLAAGGCAPVLVTVGAAADQVVAALTAAAGPGADPPPEAATGPGRPRIVRVDGWAEGMGASLRAGLAALGERGSGPPAGGPAQGSGDGGQAAGVVTGPRGIDAVVVALVDQPFVSAALVRRLVTAAGGPRQPAAVVAGYGGQPRNPVLLRREIWPGVARLAQGDVGARAWLRAHPDRVLVVDCADLGSPDDLDTPADLARLGAAAPGGPDSGAARPEADD